MNIARKLCWFSVCASVFVSAQRARCDVLFDTEKILHRVFNTIYSKLSRCLFECRIKNRSHNQHKWRYVSFRMTFAVTRNAHRRRWPPNMCAVNLIVNPVTSQSNRHRDSCAEKINRHWNVQCPFVFSHIFTIAIARMRPDVVYHLKISAHSRERTIQKGYAKETD